MRRNRLRSRTCSAVTRGPVPMGAGSSVGHVVPGTAASSDGSAGGGLLVIAQTCGLAAPRPSGTPLGVGPLATTVDGLGSSGWGQVLPHGPAPVPVESAGAQCAEHLVGERPSLVERGTAQWSWTRLWEVSRRTRQPSARCQWLSEWCPNPVGDVTAAWEVANVERQFRTEAQARRCDDRPQEIVDPADQQVTAIIGLWR